MRGKLLGFPIFLAVGLWRATLRIRLVGREHWDAVREAGKPVLFLDEPSSNLDDAGRAVVARVVADQRSRGVAVVASNDAGDLALSDERVTL